MTAVETQARARRAAVSCLCIVAGGALVGVGLTAVANGMSRLRWAHLYRQKTGEGLGLRHVGAQLTLGGVVALVGCYALFRIGRPRRRDPVERAPTDLVAYFAAGAVILVLIACAAVASWVESHGRDCIGPCG